MNRYCKAELTSDVNSCEQMGRVFRGKMLKISWARQGTVEIYLVCKRQLSLFKVRNTVSRGLVN